MVTPAQTGLRRLERKAVASDLLLVVEVGRLELWPACWSSPWCRLRWRADLRFLSTRGDRSCLLRSPTCRLRVCPPCTGGLRSRPVADASGAPVLRDQGPIGRPGTAGSIQASRGNSRLRVGHLWPRRGPRQHPKIPQVPVQRQVAMLRRITPAT